MNVRGHFRPLPLSLPPENMGKAESFLFSEAWNLLYDRVDGLTKAGLKHRQFLRCLPSRELHGKIKLPAVTISCFYSYYCFSNFNWFNHPNYERLAIKAFQIFSLKLLKVNRNFNKNTIELFIRRFISNKNLACNLLIKILLVDGS